MRNGGRNVLLHLIRRTWYSLRPPKLSPNQLREVEVILSADEYALWTEMSRADQSHSLMVLTRFDREAPGAPNAARAGVLLHDIGKIFSGLNTLERVVATLIGPRGHKFRRYTEHEELGRSALLALESDVITVETACGEGIWGQQLRRADRI